MSIKALKNNIKNFKIDIKFKFFEIVIDFDTVIASFQLTLIILSQFI